MSADLRQSLADDLATAIASAIEAMTSEQPAVSLASSTPPETENTTWRQLFSASSGCVWMTGDKATWIALGTRTLKAAGIDDGDDETAKSTFVEILGQAFSMLGRSLSGRTGVEWNCTDGAEAEPPPDLEWTEITLRFGSEASSLWAAFEPALFASIDKSNEPAAAAAAAAGGVSDVPAVISDTHVAANPVVSRSRTLDLLLEVELPVSVSFGRAQLPLKDVIKLTSGSIVELNRTITEPVEVIVNNCVIARGEVVVVEGNFGVRIQQVISREERLRTLY